MNENEWINEWKKWKMNGEWMENEWKMNKYKNDENEWRINRSE